jgi:NitT/TauT family transport system substrate-binding protein
MKPKSDAEFTALIEGFRAGIPPADPIDIDAANRMLMVMADLGGSDLVGDLTKLPDGLFIRP